MPRMTECWLSHPCVDVPVGMEHREPISRAGFFQKAWVLLGLFPANG